eukprot:CAMPEP_0170204494 /NCGR_PEP_ID=MMETSP0116_2-20130129/1775_1 /TAXON_ID=400756 /ORGANISM="Durinskia baltica, Strain CSIRO CS-38" /LENGTH=421 /DNA_ID=CAMNT_0010454853 /DNA_START=101 /DNA_END=1364 /DNA_ORIENTATION=+
MAHAMNFTGGLAHATANKYDPFSSVKANAETLKGVYFLRKLFMNGCVETFCGSVILVYALFTGLHANARALEPLACQPHWGSMFLAFHLFFLAELILRIAAFGSDLFFGKEWRWNMFDIIIVLSGVVENLIEATVGAEGCVEGSTSTSHAAPQHPVLRLVRVLRALRKIRELHIMINSILACVVPLAWVSFLIVFILWIFGIYILEFVTDGVIDAVGLDGIGVLDDPTKPYMEMRHNFGTLWASIFTLFLSITGGLDWGQVVTSPMNSSGLYHITAVFTIFIAFMALAMLNVITGFFVRRDELGWNCMQALDKRVKYKDDAMRVFQEADKDQDGFVTLDELEDFMQDPRWQCFFGDELEIDGTSVRRLFRVLDLNGDGKLSPEEFVTGCMCSKGFAKAIDIAALLFEVNRMSRKMTASISR